jgi:hypothetical protein
MIQQFFHIASISFHHEYSGNEPFEGLKIGPGGVYLLSSDPDLLSGESEPITLRLYASDPLFFNYTDLGREVRPHRDVLFFSNHNKNQGKGKLDSGDFAFDEGCLRVINQDLMRELLPALQRGDASLFDVFEEKPSIQDYTRFFVESGEAVFYVDQNGERFGLYQTGKAMDRSPTGVISLVPDRLHQTYLKQEKTVPFAIRFRSRRTYWKYILSDKLFDRFPSLAVIDAQNREVRFREGEFEIQPAWKVRSFESVEELPFTSELNRRFQLIEPPNNRSRAGKVLFKQLPKASPDQLHHLPSDTRILFSHIFI